MSTEASADRELRQAERVARNRALEEPESAEACARLAGVLNERGDCEGAREARHKADAAEKNERFGGEHTERIAGPDSGYLQP